MMIDSEKFIERLKAIQDDCYKELQKAAVKCYQDMDANYAIDGIDFYDMHNICRAYMDRYDSYTKQITNVDRTIMEINNEVKIEQEGE